MTKPRKPTPQQQQFHSELMALLAKYLETENPDTILAICSFAIGEIISIQDHTKMTSELAMEIVVRNMKAGNASAMETLVRGRKPG